MQQVRSLILGHIRLTYAHSTICKSGKLGQGFFRRLSVPPVDSSSEDMTSRVIELVKKFDRIDGQKVTATANFQKDLSLDSLDRVELVMAIEQEFSIEIPDSVADKLLCCADVAKYITSRSKSPI